jgi:hypothetical protein
MTILHLVASTRGRKPLLLDYEFAQRTWDGLRRAFPEAITAMVMPDHAHVGTPADDEDEARRRLARCLARVAHGKGRGIWDEIPPAEHADEGNTRNFRRFVRYIALNPCRDDLCADPLDWPFSTYRDAMGATVDPWIDARQLARWLRYDPGEFHQDFHRYVSSDHKVAFGGTPLPRPARPCHEPTRSLHEIQRAAAAAVRCPPGAIRTRSPARTLFVALARQQGWRDTNAIAAACGISPRAVRLQLVEHEALDTREAALCLGDARLTRWLTDDATYAGPRPDPTAGFLPRSGRSRGVGRPTTPELPDGGRNGLLGFRQKGDGKTS